MIERTLNSLASDPDAALRRIWELAGDTFKYYYRDDTLDEFIKDAKQTSDEFATSFYGMALTGKRWTVLRPFAVAGGELCGNQPVRTSGFSAMMRPCRLRRVVTNRNRHAIEQTARRWRGGRREDSARTCRKILISTQVARTAGLGPVSWRPWRATTGRGSGSGSCGSGGGHHAWASGTSSPSGVVTPTARSTSLSKHNCIVITGTPPRPRTP